MDANRLFREAELRAEALVSRLRLAVTAVLALAFYLAVVRAAPTADDILARQIVAAGWALGAYLAIGLISLALSRPGRFRPWMSWAFATCDVAVIGAALEMSLRNMGLPGHYLAAAPGIWLAPVLLGFGALRYNPALQAYVTTLLVATLAVTGAWTAEFSEPARETPPQALARFFGAPSNVMRLLMVLMAGGLLAVAVVRSRRLLARAIEESARRANLTRYLPVEIAGWLSRASLEEARSGTRHPVGVVFADLRGFTARAERMDPAELGPFVTDFRARMAAAARAHGGVIDKFIGDAVMVVFGVPRPHPEDARRTLDCARAILAEVADWSRARGEPIKVGVGAHWGEAYCGAVGDEQRLEFTVLGDTVNVAARLEEASKTLGWPLVASRALLEAAGEDAAGWTSLGLAPLRGRRAETEILGWRPPPEGANAEARLISRAPAPMSPEPRSGIGGEHDDGGSEATQG